MHDEAPKYFLHIAFASIRSCPVQSFRKMAGPGKAAGNV
jgi:hypothetical protein